jgi:hypothetical protein
MTQSGNLLPSEKRQRDFCVMTNDSWSCLNALKLQKRSQKLFVETSKLMWVVTVKGFESNERLDGVKQTKFDWKISRENVEAWRSIKGWGGWEFFNWRGGDWMIGCDVPWLKAFGFLHAKVSPRSPLTTIIVDSSAKMNHDNDSMFELRPALRRDSKKNQKEFWLMIISHVLYELSTTKLLDVNLQLVDFHLQLLCSFSVNLSIFSLTFSNFPNIPSKPIHLPQRPHQIHQLEAFTGNHYNRFSSLTYFCFLLKVMIKKLHWTWTLSALTTVESHCDVIEI